MKSFYHKSTTQDRHLPRERREVSAMRVIVCDRCDVRIGDAEIEVDEKTENGVQPWWLSVSVRYAGSNPKGSSVDMCWKCFDELRGMGQ